MIFLDFGSSMETPSVTVWERLRDAIPIEVVDLQRNVRAGGVELAGLADLPQLVALEVERRDADDDLATPSADDILVRGLTHDDLHLAIAVDIAETQSRTTAGPL